MNFTVYKSSAGSGKTHTLVTEYLCLVIKNPEKFRNILAITFTNKAANEMKSRVISYLKALGSNIATQDSPILEDLIRKIKDNTGMAENVISERAGQAIKLILHNYSNFAVCTIDSFVHRVVRTFAGELKLPLNFEVELDSEQLISKSVDVLISKAGTDKNLTIALVNFIESKLNDEKSWNIENDLKNFAGELLREESFEHIQKLKNISIEEFLIIFKKISAKIRSFETRLKELALETSEFLDRNNILPKSFKGGLRSGFPKYLSYLIDGRRDKFSPTDTVRKCAEENDWYPKTCAPEQKILIDSVSDELQACFNKIDSYLENGIKDYKLYILLKKQIYPIAVLNEIQKIIDEFRENENLVHISEFNKRISEIVSSEPIPFIYERIGEKYHHFLVDEFQDTSVLQWQNLLPLIENSLSNNFFNMVVGDGKQAIYRFRDGEVEQFVCLPDIYKRKDDEISRSRENVLKRSYNEKFLNSNYRSKAEIVDFNNRFFGFACKFLGEQYQPIYKELEQKYQTDNTGGQVSVEFVEQEDLTNEEFDNIIFDKIKEIITLELSGYSLNDIAILCRKNNEGSKIAKHLIENGINVISSESLLLSSSPAVNFLVSVFKYLNDRTDKIAITEIFRFLIQKNKAGNKSLDELLDLYSAISTSEKCKREDVGLTNIIKKIGFNVDFGELKKLPLYELSEEILRIFRLSENISDPYIRFFLDFVLEYQQKYDEGIPGFLEFWEEKKSKQSVIAPEGANAVRIMTIHKAKGLEFPVVIFPSYGGDAKKPGKNSLWFDFDNPVAPNMKSVLLPTQKSLEETIYAEGYNEEKQKTGLDLLNLLYVVMTRPTERLYVLTKYKKPSNSSGLFSVNDGIPKLFIEYFKHIDEWSDEQLKYSFGEGTDGVKFSEAENELNETEQQPDTFKTGNWRNRIRISRKAPEIWDVENPDRNTEWGNLVHFIMSKIITKKDVPDVLDEIEMQGLINAFEKETLWRKVNKLLSNPKISSFYKPGPKVLNEQDILVKDGKTFRPDRLIIIDDKIVIIDYKTGKEEKHHIKQLNNYESIIKKMGYRNVEKYLLYLDEEKILKVS